MTERIKQLRRKLNLTQDAFAARIGVKRGAIANYEIGRNVPADSVVALICREFHVREEWLRFGEGEMFAPTPTSALDALASERGLSRGEVILVEKLLALKPQVRQGILDYIMDVAAAVSAETQPQCQKSPDEMTVEDLRAELDRQLTEEKETAVKSEVS